LRFFDLQIKRRQSTKLLVRSASLVLGRHFRVLPQQLVTGYPVTTPVEFLSSRRISPGDRHAGLPHRHHPFSKFLTLSTGLSHLNLVALFHATSTHRISAFRAFPSRPAVTSLDALCSLVISVDFVAHERARAQPPLSYDFRALLRSSFRSREFAVRRPLEPMLS
jgi:hypothetical protein